ncbi:hypothetical protein ACTXT7_001598 [Hymenolepis weldensis]
MEQQAKTFRDGSANTVTKIIGAETAQADLLKWVVHTINQPCSTFGRQWKLLVDWRKHNHQFGDRLGEKWRDRILPHFLTPIIEIEGKEFKSTIVFIQRFKMWSHLTGRDQRSSELYQSLRIPEKSTIQQKEAAITLTKVHTVKNANAITTMAASIGK